MQDPGKYPLADAPDYMTELQNQVKDMDPPEFSKQGEHAGKTRGRKAKAKAAPKTKGSSQAKSQAITQTQSGQQGQSCKWIRRTLSSRSC